jgi:hypothetical protein
MAVVNSIRDFHSQLADLCDSMEALFDFIGGAHNDVQAAVSPALARFRELLDAADFIAGPDKN